MKAIDMTGQRIGKLTVIERAPNIGNDAAWLCLCDCGGTTVKKGTYLRQGRNSNCGCVSGKLEDLTGQTFGKLTVVEQVKTAAKTKWKCQCSCGNTTEVEAYNLKNGHTKSCGCLKEEVAEDLTGQQFNYLTVLGRVKREEGNRWECQCKCGNITYIRDKSQLEKTLSCGCIKSEKEHHRYTPLAGKRINSLVVLEDNFDEKSGTYSTSLCRCDCGNVKRMARNGLLNGTTKTCGCSSQGVAEKTFVEWLKNVYDGEIQTSNITILHPKEIDVYLPQEKLGIEFNEIYWHSSRHKDATYHLNKTLGCEKQGIHLIHIWDKEWEEKTEIIKDKILYMLNLKTAPKVYARKCYVAPIESKTRNDCLQKWHIQGADRANISLGLFVQETQELVSVMSFVKPRINMGKNQTNTLENEYELSRFASSLDHIVIGAFSKILKYALDNYKIDFLYTYADRRFTSALGNSVYESNGFKFIGTSAPGYSYVIDDHLEGRFSWQKAKLGEKLERFDENLSEVKNMENNGYYQLFDCGTLKFEWKS